MLAGEMVMGEVVTCHVCNQPYVPDLADLSLSRWPRCPTCKEYFERHDGRRVGVPKDSGNMNDWVAAGEEGKP
jgi:hypothetical protein